RFHRRHITNRRYGSPKPCKFRCGAPQSRMSRRSKRIVRIFRLASLGPFPTPPRGWPAGHAPGAWGSASDGFQSDFARTASANVALSLRDRIAERARRIAYQFGFPVAERQGYLAPNERPVDRNGRIHIIPASSDLMLRSGCQPAVGRLCVQYGRSAVMAGDVLTFTD